MPSDLEAAWGHPRIDIQSQWQCGMAGHRGARRRRPCPSVGAGHRPPAQASGKVCPEGGAGERSGYAAPQGHLCEITGSSFWACISQVPPSAGDLTQKSCFLPGLALLLKMTRAPLHWSGHSWRAWQLGGPGWPGWSPWEPRSYSPTRAGRSLLSPNRERGYGRAVTYRPQPTSILLGFFSRLSIQMRERFLC